MLTSARSATRGSASSASLLSFRSLLLGSREVQLIPIAKTILERAASLRATADLKTPDAIHAATALSQGCALFVTNDPAFRRVLGLPAAVLSELAAV
ncbi:MAG: type II toxin-antitoxin system VapC family toxin [Anaerolineae bacterium]